MVRVNGGGVNHYRPDYFFAEVAFDVTTGRPASFQPFHPPRRAAVFLIP